ncbi:MULTISPECIES: hypothetical protein [Pseudomonas]|uniref:hypothetical protein n=1 Tax=Pseudomonas TaxID=286 RepID=UPI00235E5578|nr:MULTISPECIES: hypothetical protein [Pseudomonas]WJV25580.1 hypothetical protein PSR66_05945 [Pseudomonas chlororaphis]
MRSRSFRQLSNRLTSMHQGPRLRINQEQGTARITSAKIPEQWNVDSFGMILKCWPNRDEIPNLMSEFTYQAAGA